MSIHTYLLNERQKARRLKRKDRRAVAVLVKLYGYHPSSFATGDGWLDGGRLVYWWRGYTDCGMEWDCKPALEELDNLESNEHFAECLGCDGELLPKKEWPPYPPSAMHKLPAGWRWRGGRLVPVDKHGAMVRATQAAKQGGKP